MKAMVDFLRGGGLTPIEKLKRCDPLKHFTNHNLRQVDDESIAPSAL
jgi:hypothetical protein